MFKSDFVIFLNADDVNNCFTFTFKACKFLVNRFQARIVSIERGRNGSFIFKRFIHSRSLGGVDFMQPDLSSFKTKSLISHFEIM